jgi:tetratricopeptide (TPR) repeat protein
MDTTLFLQHLHDVSLEEGRAYIQAHIAELADHDAIGSLLAEDALRQLYTPFLSLKLAELLIYFGESIHHLSSHALGLKAKGDALVQIGHYQSAMESLDAAGEEFLSLGDEGNWARSRISWIVAAASLGRVEEALQEAARARDIFLRYGEYYWVCIIDTNTGVIYAQIGRYQDAIRVYKQMLVIYPTLSDQSEAFIKRSIAISEANQALNFARLGKFEQSYRLLQQAQVSFMALKETSLIINTEIHLAELYYIQGYYGSALRCYYQAQDILIQNKIDNPRLLAELQLQMANALVKLNRAYEACQLMNEAVGMYRQLGTSLQASNVLREYATTLAASGRLQEALAALNEAWMLFHQGGFDYYTSITKLQQAELLLEMGSVAEAYNEARIIKEYFKAQGLVARSIRASLVMVASLIEQAQQAELHREKEQQAILLQEAVVICKQGASQARQHHLQEEVYKSKYLLGRLFALQGDARKAAKYYKVAITQIERILDDLVYDLSPSFLQTAWTVYEDMIALCLQQEQAGHAFSYLERARSMALHQYLNTAKMSYDKNQESVDKISSDALQTNSAAVLQAQDELKDWQERYRRYSVLLSQIDISVSPTVERGVIEAELKRCETKLSELFERLYLHKATARLAPFVKKRERRNATQLDLAQMRQHLSPGQLLLAYFLYKGGLVIFAVTAEHLVTYENPDGMKQLERLLPLLHAHLQPGGWPNSQQPPQQGVRQMLNKLYNLLIAPVAAYLPPPSGYLTIVPYGPLHNLPFHALYDGSHFLIENYQINYLPASSLLLQRDTLRREQDGHSLEAEVALKPALIFGYSGQGHLQRALEEARTLATMLGGCRYLEDEATIARLIEEAPGSPIIHLATHGHSRLDAPNFSAVLLADGRFNAIDAFSLDLKGCELVTLSGCETGLALSSGGDEQLGLGRAFLAAGAGALVMSLWPVEDNATNELMQLFYQNLLGGESKVQALRAAQCAFIHRTTLIDTHPYYWAAFRLVGEVSPLKYQRETDAQKSGLSTSQDQEVDVIDYTSSTARLVERQGGKNP